MCQEIKSYIRSNSIDRLSIRTDWCDALGYKSTLDPWQHQVFMNPLRVKQYQTARFDHSMKIVLLLKSMKEDEHFRMGH